MTRVRSIVRGVGSYLPQKILTNEELAKTVDTSDEWIQQRVGIKERHVAAEGEFTSDLAVAAARAALDNAGLTPDDIDLIIVATTTPDYTFPAAATLVQMKLGMHHGFAFDLQAVCSGFVYGVTTADTYLKAGLAKRALVIGAETFTRLLDWSDRTTCVLFGDGAGAMILERVELADGEPERGVIERYSARNNGRRSTPVRASGRARRSTPAATSPIWNTPASRTSCSEPRPDKPRSSAPCIDGGARRRTSRPDCSAAIPSATIRKVAKLSFCCPTTTAPASNSPSCPTVRAARPSPNRH